MPPTMLAVVKPDSAPGAEIREVKVPAFGSSDVLVKVKVASICGTDLHIYNWDRWAQNRIHPPLIPGHEFSGHVVRVGASVSDVALGTAVTADINVGCGRCFYCRKNETLNCPTMAQIGIHVDGGLAEYVKVPASHLVTIPRHTPVALGALVEPVSCIVRAVKKSRLRQMPAMPHR